MAAPVERAMDQSIPPQPVPDADTLGFWQATRRGELELCRCDACGRFLQPPLERCRHCGGATSFAAVSGRGTIHSFIVARHPAVPGYLEDLPYVVGLVELDEQPGLRLVGRIIASGTRSVTIGDRVRAEIVPLAGGEFQVPVFRLAETGG